MRHTLRMARLLLVLCLAVIAIGVALWVQRRRPDAPIAVRPDLRAPTRLEREDFDRPDAPWLVVVFTSSTCGACEDVWSKAEVLDSADVAVQRVEVSVDGDLHRRYGVDAVPIVAIASADGTVSSSFVGPVTSTHLWAAVAELRAPGSVPPGCSGHTGD